MNFSNYYHNLSYLLEAVEPEAKFDELFGKIQRKVGEIDNNTKNAIIKIFKLCRNNDRITYIAPYLKLRVLEDLGAKDMLEGELDKLKKRDGLVGNPFGLTISSIARDVEHFFGNERYLDYLRNYTFQNKGAAWDVHKDEMNAIIKKFEERSDKFLNITSDDVEGQELIIRGKDSNNLYYEWWSLNTDSCNRKESTLMGHCGSNPEANNMLSLRLPVDPKFKKVYGLSDKEYKNLRVPVLTFAMRDTTLVESHGKNNEKPAEEYHHAIVDLLKSEYVSDIDQTSAYSKETIFKLDDLSSDLREQVDLDETAKRSWVSVGDLIDEIIGNVVNRLEVGGLGVQFSRSDFEQVDSSDYDDSYAIEYSDAFYFSMDLSHSLDLYKTMFKSKYIMSEEDFDESWQEFVIDEIESQLQDEDEILYDSTNIFDMDHLDDNTPVDDIAFNSDGEVEFTCNVRITQDIDSNDMEWNDYGEISMEDDDFESIEDDLYNNIHNAISGLNKMQTHDETGSIKWFLIQSDTNDITSFVEDRIHDAMVLFDEVDDADYDLQISDVDLDKLLGYIRVSNKGETRSVINLKPTDEKTNKKLANKSRGEDVVFFGDDPNKTTFDFYKDVVSDTHSNQPNKFRMDKNYGTHFSLSQQVELDKVDLIKYVDHLKFIENRFNKSTEDSNTLLESSFKSVINRLLKI